MNALDILIILILGISTLSALWRGLITEVMSVIVWGLALWVSATFSGTFADAALSGIEPPSVKIGTAYLSLFFAVLILGGMLNWTLKKLMQKTGLSSTDRSLGALFGLFRGLLIVFSAVLFASFTALPKLPIWQQSALMPTVHTLALKTSLHLPESVRNYVKFPEPVPRAEPLELPPEPPSEPPSELPSEPPRDSAAPAERAPKP